MERFGFIFLVAGLGFFVLAFGISAYLPTLGVQDLHVVTVEEMAQHPPQSFLELKEQYPKAYRAAFFTKTDEQALTELQAQAPETFKRVFALTDEQALAQVQKLHPDVWKKAFSDSPVADVASEMAFDRDAVIAKIKEADAKAYSEAFELSVQSAVATMAMDYALALTRIKNDNPEVFQKVFEERSDADVFAEAIRLGHHKYIGEGCWHCHSQQIRPWGGDEARYGQVSYPEEYHNELNMPPLWGTRRIGPDLIRRGGKYSNDWHVAHFYNPRDTSPVSVMPAYPWFYDADGLTPNKTGLSMITYVQWLGSWQGSRTETVHEIGAIERSAPSAQASTTPR